MYITTAGYQVETYDNILDDIVTDIKTAIPEFDESDANIIMNMNKKMADMFHKMSLYGLDLYNARAVDTASSSALEDLVKNFGLIRKPAIPSTGYAQFTGDDGTTIPTGFRISTLNNKIYQTSESGTISGGVLELAISSVDKGVDTQTSENTITTIVNPLTGVSTVSNSSSITGGTDLETDVELRERYYLAISGLEKSTYYAIQSAIINNTDATKVNIIENDTDNTVDTVPPHSFEPIVLGGDADEILYQIFSTRALGIQSYGTSESATFEGKYDCAFTRPITNSVSFSVTITKNTNVVLSDAIATIKSDIISAISTLGIGDTINHSTFLSAMYKSTGAYISNFSDFSFWIDSEDIKSLGDSIVQTSREVASISEEDIAITVV